MTRALSRCAIFEAMASKDGSCNVPFHLSYEGIYFLQNDTTFRCDTNDLVPTVQHQECHML